MNRVEPNRNVYVGHRYVPLLVGEWDKSIQYEGLSIVTFQGASYTSKKMTPPGIDIGNEEYWVVTGNYDAQVEYYRLETKRVSDDLAQAKIDLNERIDDTVQYVDTNVENLTIYVNDEVRKNREYVDSEIVELTGYVNDEIKETKEYVDGEVVQLTNHVNDEVRETKEYVDTEISETNRLVNEKITETRDYVDGEVTSARDYVDDETLQINRKLYPIQSNVPYNASMNRFMDSMNEKAKILGMNNTQFVNPTGLHDANQNTTILDMLTMGINALDYKEITRAWGRHQYNVNVLGSNSRNFNIERTIEESSVDDNYIMYGGKTGTLRTGGTTFNLLSTVGVRNEPYNFIGVVSTEGTSRNTATRELFDNMMTSIKHKIDFDYIFVNVDNGNFDLDFDSWGINAGSPTLDREEYFSYPQSLNVSGTEPQQVRKSIKFNTSDIYYISGWVKCTRYNAGGIGFSLNNFQGESVIERTTNGWEKVSMRIQPEHENTTLFFGSLNSADLDGNVDKLVVTNLTTQFGAGNEPSKSYLDERNYTDVIAEYCAGVQVPVGGGLSTDNLEPIFSKRENATIRPASWTKVMTAMMLLDHYPDITTKMNIIENDLSSGSGTEMMDGDIITINDAIYLLMMESNNTVANAVARIVGKKIYIDNE